MSQPLDNLLSALKVVKLTRQERRANKRLFGHQGPIVLMSAEQIEQLRQDPDWAQTDVRGNRHGADASQPGPAHPLGDSRHLEGGG